MKEKLRLNNEIYEPHLQTYYRFKNLSIQMPESGTNEQTVYYVQVIHNIYSI